MIQYIKKNDELIIKAKIKLVTVNQKGKPIKIHPDLEKHFLID